LKHPWLQEFSKPETITEEAEEGEDAEEAAQAVSNLHLGSGTEDEEVAAWVKGILTSQKDGKQTAHAERPALHAAPLDTVSPMASPQIGSGPAEV
jgi:mitogen-activated protein kinase kinase